MALTRSFFDTLVGKRIAGRYLVDRLIGSGGMGIVAAAHYPELGQKVAIKFLRPELGADPLVSARFMREARVAAKVKSAHFVRVFDVGRLESGTPYLVMEMLTGRDVGDEIAQRGPLAVAEAVDLLLQAAAGVAEIHALGIVHRDLKPSNLFIATMGGSSIVKVLDFGISKEKKTESLVALTATDHVLGTPQYMSPEQIKASREVDARSDLWSLGVILYELVTKSLPFVSEGGGVGEMFGKILYVDPEPPSSRRDDLPEGFEAVIMKCLQREPSARYESVIELAEALRPFVNEGSAHRVDAVKHAGIAPAAEVDDDPILEVGEGEVGGAGKRAELAPTVRSDPKLMAETVGKPGTPRLTPSQGAESNSEGVAAVSAAPVTSMTSSSVITSSSSVPKPGGSRKVLAAVALGVVAIGSVVGVLASRGPSATSAGSASAEASSVKVEADAGVNAGANAGAGANANASANANANANANEGANAGASAASAASAAAGKVAVPSAAVTAKPHVPHAPVGTGKPATRPTAAAPASAPPLILDRK